MKATEPPTAMSSIGRNASESGLDQPGEERHRGDEEHGHLRARGERDLGRELDVPAVGDDDGAAVLGRVPDDGDDHRGDEELGQAQLLGERLERVDERLGDERGHDRGGARGPRARAAATKLPSWPPRPRRGGSCAGAARARSRRHRGRGARSTRARRAPASECRSGSPSQPGIDGMRKSRTAMATSANDGEARLAVEPAGAAEDEREAQHEQEVSDHAARQRAADDLRQALVDGDQRDDQLGRVPEGRVEEAADARAGVVRRVLGRLADQPRQRDERGGRKYEERRCRRRR